VVGGLRSWRSGVLGSPSLSKAHLGSHHLGSEDLRILPACLSYSCHTCLPHPACLPAMMLLHRSTAHLPTETTGDCVHLVSWPARQAASSRSPTHESCAPARRAQKLAIKHGHLKQPKRLISAQQALQPRQPFMPHVYIYPVPALLRCRMTWRLGPSPSACLCTWYMMLDARRFQRALKQCLPLARRPKVRSTRSQAI
jgi:hypothetical protein